jgi:hypothetical protein
VDWSLEVEGTRQPARCSTIGEAPMTCSVLGDQWPAGPCSLLGIWRHGSEGRDRLRSAVFDGPLVELG